MSKKLTKSEIAAGVKASALMAQLDKLSTDREKFELGLQKRSNEKLYEICSLIYGMYLKANASKAVMKETLNCMRTELTKRGMRIQKNTTALGLFIRYVFNSDRQSTYVYQRALQYLLSKNISPNDAVKFINDMGGIDHCFKRYQPSETQIQNRSKITEAMSLVDEVLNPTSSQSIGKLKVPAFFVEQTSKDELTLLIARSDTKGNINVLTVVPKMTKGMLALAKQELALFLSKQHEAATTKQRIARKDSTIEKAVANATKARQKKVAAGTATVEEALS